MTMKLKDPYYSARERANGMVTLNWRKTVDGTGSTGRPKTNKVVVKPIKKVKRKKKKVVKPKAVTFQSKIIDTVEWEYKQGYYKKYKLDGKEILLSDLIYILKTSSTKINQLSKKYCKIVTKDHVIDVSQYSRDKLFNVYKYDKLIAENVDKYKAGEIIDKSISGISTYALSKRVTKEGFRLEHVED